MADIGMMTTEEIEAELRQRKDAENQAAMQEYVRQQELRQAERHAALAARVRLVLPEVTGEQLRRLKDIFWDYDMEEMG